MEEPANEARESPLPQEVAQGQPLPLRFIGVMLASVGVTLWLCRIYFGDSTPELTHKRSQEAESRWQASQVLDYNLQVVLQKAKPELFEIQVRGGRPRQATLNGTPLTETRAMETWTVPGMFTTIQEDLAHLDAFEQRTATKATPRLRLWCEFDSVTGVPLRYRRLEWNKGLEITWQVRNFQRVIGEPGVEEK